MLLTTFFVRHSALCLLTAALLLGSCASPGLLSSVDYRKGKPVKNIVLIVGDGMGISQVSASMYARDNVSVFEQFPVSGLIKTHSSDRLITDSASGATAFSTGKKTYNGAIAMDVNRQPLYTIFQEAADRGYSTGVVVTSTITHATPAAFYAHNESRNHYEAIAADLAVSELQVAIGYGREQFTERADRRNLIPVMEERGFALSDRLEDVRVRRNQRQLVLLPGIDPPPFDQRPKDFLKRASLLALEQLSASRKPFILVVEGSQIDWAGHANDQEYLLGEMADFEESVAAILDWAMNDRNTLVVVTSDHETGAYSITQELSESPGFSGSFASGQHSATMVPVFAAGPAATLFSGMYDNTDIHSKMRRALGWE